MIQNMQNWHLRFAVTARCNYRCAYCNPEGLWAIKNDMSKNEILEILQAAYNNGINRVHWTGGEPTVRRDFPELVEGANDIGFEKQIITTNGWNLDKMIGNLVDKGITRVIVSLDTFRKSEQFIKEANEHVLGGIEKAVELLSEPTKISCVTMKKTLFELKDFVEYVDTINNKGYKGRLILKLNQFFPSNPAQLTPEGEKFWLSQLISYKDILDALGSIGNLEPIDRSNVEGDNPSYRYFNIGGYKATVGVLALFSWNYPCGRCHKFRILPSGNTSICLSEKDTPSLIGKSLEEKTEIIRERMRFREEDLDRLKPDRHHFRPQLGGCRFGEVHEPKPMEYFYKLASDHDGKSSVPTATRP